MTINLGASPATLRFGSLSVSTAMLGAQAVFRSGPSSYTGLVATNTRMANTNNNTLFYFNARTQHIARDTITQLAVVLPNWRSTSGTEANGPGTATFTAAIEYPIGTFTQLLFGGNASGTVAA